MTGSATSLYVALCLAAAAPALAQSADGGRQEFAADHFAVQLPLALAPSKVETSGPSGQRLTETVYRAVEDGATFEVAVADLPGLSDQAALDWGVKAVTGQGKVRMAVTERIDRVFGRDLTIDAAGGGRVTAAVFYVKDKLYMLQATAAGPDPAAKSSQSLRFQQSLEFIGYGFEAGRPENQVGGDPGPGPGQGGPPGGRPGPPPPQAFADCKDKAAGDAVQHTTPFGVVPARCVMTPAGLAARPDRPPPGAPPA